MLVGAFLPEPDDTFGNAEQLLAELVKRSSRYAFQVGHTLHAEERFALAFVATDARRLDCLISSDVPTPTRAWCHLHKIAPAEARRIASAEANDFALGRAPTVGSNRTLLAWDASSNRVRIATDRLGISRLFFAPRGRGFVFSPDFAAVASLCHPKPRADVDSALLQFCYGYAPDDSTIFDAVKLIGPRTILTLGAGLQRTERTAPATYGDAYFATNLKRKYEALDAACEATASRWLNGDPPFLVSFSAGFDSRYGLALAHKQGQEPQLWTFGDARSEEAMRARAIAEAVGTSIQNFGCSQSSWEAWARCTSQVGSLAMNQWAGWAESWLMTLRDHAPAVVIGCFGDALTGKWIPQHALANGDWVGYWLKWSENRSRLDSDLLVPGAGQRAEHLMRAHFENSARDVSVAAPFQVAQHLNLSVRQRRQTGNQPSLIERYLVPLPFFSDDSMLDFWSNVPLDDLVGQRLYLDYAASRFPNLFGSARLRTQGYTFWDRVLRRLRVGGVAPEPRPAVIDNARPLIDHREELLAALDRLRRDWSAVFDLRRLESSFKEFPVPGNKSQAHAHLLTSLANLVILDHAVPS